MELLQWQKVCKIGGDELHRPPVVALNVGKLYLPPIFDQLFNEGGQDKLVIKTKVKEAIPKLRLKKIAIGTHYKIVRD